jgi:hypothetical protein
MYLLRELLGDMSPTHHRLFSSTYSRPQSHCKYKALTRDPNGSSTTHRAKARCSQCQSRRASQVRSIRLKWPPLTLNSAITAHPEWRAPPNPQPTLFYLWDFVSRSKYMLSEYETIKSGRAVEKPQNFTGSVGGYFSYIFYLSHVKCI